MYLYAPKAHIMYLTVFSQFLISFGMEGSGPSREIKFRYAPEQPEQGEYLFTHLLLHPPQYGP
jgi:hypothetical protein